MLRTRATRPAQLNLCQVLQTGRRLARSGARGVVLGIGRLRRWRMSSGRSGWLWRLRRGARKSAARSSRWRLLTRLLWLRVGGVRWGRVYGSVLWSRWSWLAVVALRTRLLGPLRRVWVCVRVLVPRVLLLVRALVCRVLVFGRRGQVGVEAARMVRARVGPRMVVLVSALATSRLPCRA